jgi:threonine aldolase
MDGLIRAARDAGLAVHLDGARLWNAAVAAGVKPARLAQGVDTVMVSISKALGCPVGSCLGLRKDQRARGWEIRKRLGGGMRQSGILAAAGLYALDHNLDRIAEDHANARRFAEILSNSQTVRPSDPQSNIVMVDLHSDAQPASARLAQAGVLMSAYGPKRLRAVMHLDVLRADVERAARILLDTLR